MAVSLYGAIFLVLSAVFLGLAGWLGLGKSQLAAFALLWPASIFGAVGVAYLLLEPRLLGKRTDGSFSPLRRLFFLPFVAFSEGLWHLYALFTSEPPYDLVAPNLWVGRWPGNRRLPDGVEVVIDVTAELPAHRSLTRSKRYVCLPALDATVPNEADFRKVARQFVPEKAGIFIHCAFGHGRSAMMAAALLVARGEAADVFEAERLMKASRPRIGLNALQRGYVDRFVAEYSAIARP